MVLTPRQKEELKSAVASFLKEIGADEARKIFIQESNVKNVRTRLVNYSFYHCIWLISVAQTDNLWSISYGLSNFRSSIEFQVDDKKYDGLLEKKWTTIQRLQKKVMSLFVPFKVLSYLI